MCTLYGLCPGTYFGILIKKKVEVMKFKLTPPAHFMPAAVVHITARASKHAVLCAGRRVRTLIRVRNCSLAQDGGEVLVIRVVSFAREVASRVS